MTATKKRPARKTVHVRTPVRQRPSGPGARKFAITDDEREAIADETSIQVIPYAPLMKKEARMIVVPTAIVARFAGVPLSAFLAACKRDYLWVVSRQKKWRADEKKRRADERAEARRAVAKPKRA